MNLCELDVRAIPVRKRPRCAALATTTAFASEGQLIDVCPACAEWLAGARITDPPESS